MYVGIFIRNLPVLCVEFLSSKRSKRLHFESSRKCFSLIVNNIQKNSTNLDQIIFNLYMLKVIFIIPSSRSTT